MPIRIADLKFAVKCGGGITQPDEPQLVSYNGFVKSPVDIAHGKRRAVDLFVPPGTALIGCCIVVLAREQILSLIHI